MCGSLGDELVTARICLLATVKTGLAGEQEETRTPSERAQDLGRDVRWTEGPH